MLRVLALAIVLVRPACCSSHPTAAETAAPPPAPSWKGGEFDCGTRRLAQEYADAVLPGSAHSAVIAEALQFAAAKCPPAAASANTDAATEAHAGVKADAAAAPRITRRFLNPISGDDVGNDGTTSTQSWRTLSRALLFLEQRASSSPHSSASSTSSVVIELAPGTYHLQNGTLALDARHSGSGPGSEVIFEASDPTPGATVVSGGVPLDPTHGVTWQYNATSGAWVGDLDTVNHPSLTALAAAGINAMSVHRSATKPVTAAPAAAAAAAAATATANPPSSSPPSLSSPPASSQTPLRRARWPNGDPTTYCARDLHGGNCKGYAQVSNTLTKGTSQGIVPVGPTNVLVRSKESGAVIFNGMYVDTHTHTHIHIHTHTHTH